MVRPSKLRKGVSIKREERQILKQKKTQSNSQAHADKHTFTRYKHVKHEIINTHLHTRKSYTRIHTC